MEDDLAVRSRPEASAPRLQNRPQLHEVVDLTIGDEGEALVDHGLVSSLEVDDGQPRVGETQRPRQVDAHVVGTAMVEGRRHPTNHRLVRGTVAHEHARYAAHETTPLPSEHSPIPEGTARIRASSRPARWYLRIRRPSSPPRVGCRSQGPSRAGHHHPMRARARTGERIPRNAIRADRGTLGGKGARGDRTKEAERTESDLPMASIGGPRGSARDAGRAPWAPRRDRWPR